MRDRADRFDLSALFLCLPIGIPILLQRHSRNFLKLAAQMALGGKTKIHGNGAVGVGGIDQHIFCQPYFFTENVFRNGDSFFAMEQA